MSYDFTWRWAKGVSVADVTSMEKPKRGWNGMDTKYNGIGGKILIELHALDQVSGGLLLRTVLC